MKQKHTPSVPAPGTENTVPAPGTETAVPAPGTETTVPVPAPGRGVPGNAPAVRPADAHRVQPDDVLIRGYHRLAENTYTLDVDWAGRHVFFEPALGSVHHHMLVAQTLRQIGLSLAHTEFGISSAYQFLMSGMRYSVDPRHRTDRAPVRAEAVCTVTGRRGMRIAISLEQRGRVFVTSESGFSWVSDRVYRRLRGPFLAARPGVMPSPVGGALTGRGAADEVVLGVSDRPDRWELIADTGNPALMDHPVDHVPGLVIMEASQQAAYAVVAGAGVRSWRPLTTDMRTSRYVEFDAPCWIDAREVTPDGAPDGVAVEVTGTQRGEVAFRSVVEGVAAPVGVRE
ncbi:ScbA/BarX family gamma-butyrolactone biosynthesis protein [Streptomyces sp. NBC_00102]|uniref:ScbA/BarX family gamma-butyrolactone biosynthesis protein n=1 Tax=Streptomyces sp. NBC_00102 TaxID=2975652 RepID=UPI0022523786|nr:ScbA/BarX family gamma-butyrolactone biosynthesis protein [Streptomyces sp. NBC_00102]MCX5399743.1 ScbA/BarX family gamma-butyrolactone biosynthesis protein [Streptomyces sp. NBC_00102]